jgi:hypothetical protein
MADTRKVFLTSSHYTRDINGEMFVLTPDKMNVLRLNDTGRFLWKLISSGPQTYHGLAQKLEKEYLQTYERAMTDVYAFTASLIDMKLAAIKEKKPVKK